MSHHLSSEEIERGLVAAGVPREKARVRSLQVIARAPSAQAHNGIGQRRHREAVAIIGPVVSPIRAMRWLDGFRCTIDTPPRTKKNGGAGGFMGIKQRPAYRRYRDLIVEGFEPLLAGLNLPLEERDYNFRASFFVDKGGEQADLVGLLQGLADALENAHVVKNDRWFRAFDGSRAIAGDPRPRVELLISPLDGKVTRGRGPGPDGSHECTSCGAWCLCAEWYDGDPCEHCVVRL